jgi:hypothetical protein
MVQLILSIIVFKVDGTKKYYFSRIVKKYTSANDRQDKNLKKTVYLGRVKE